VDLLAERKRGDKKEERRKKEAMEWDKR